MFQMSVGKEERFRMHTEASVLIALAIVFVILWAVAFALSRMGNSHGPRLISTTPGEITIECGPQDFDIPAAFSSTTPDEIVRSVTIVCPSPVRPFSLEVYPIQSA